MNNRLMQFLMGLNSEFEAAKNQILILDPLPSVNKAYSIIQRIEQQREIESVEAPVMFSKTGNNFQKGGSKPPWNKVNNKHSQAFKSKEEKDKLICTHCGGRRHEESHCFKLHGYPDWFHALKESRKASANFSNDIPDSSSGTSQKPDFTHLIQQEIAKYLGNSTPKRGTPSGSTDSFANFVEYAGNISCFQFALSMLDCLGHGNWIFVTGASRHMTYESSFFTSGLQPLSHPITIYFPDGSHKLVTHSGHIHLSASLILLDVLYIPSFKYNLLSISHVL